MLVANNSTNFFSCAGGQLERLLILESEFGTLPGFTPTLDTVIDFMTTVRSAISTWPHASTCRHM